MIESIVTTKEEVKLRLRLEQIPCGGYWGEVVEETDTPLSQTTIVFDRVIQLTTSDVLSQKNIQIVTSTWIDIQSPIGTKAQKE